MCANSMIKGNDILIYEDGVAVAASRSCEVMTSCGLKEISSPASGVYRDFRAGRKSWNVGLSFLVTDVTNRLLHVGDKVLLKIGVRDEDDDLTTDQIAGYAICTAAKVTATRGNLSQGSWSFQGCGVLAPSEYNLMDVNSLNLMDVNGTNLIAPGIEE